MADYAGDATGPISDVGPYRILRRLGRGGMAEVYVGKHTLIGRTAAIKILHEEHAREERMRARFLNEARAVASISHPNVVTLYEVGQTDDGDAYLAMELLDGESLGQRLRRLGQLPPAEAVAIARKIADALSAAHARNVVHRDLKPTNVMLVPDGDGGERVVVLDFGIAKMFEADGSDELTKTGAILGTPTYMSPEQCRGHGEVDHRTDIYSLGVVLYRMVTGRPPFKSKGAGEVLGMHLYVPATPPSEHTQGLPPELDHFIMRCLEKDPASRFQTMADLSATLDNLASSSSESRTLAPTTPFVRPPTHDLPHDQSAVRQLPFAEIPPAANLLRPRRIGLILTLSGLAGILAALLLFAAHSPDTETTTPTHNNTSTVTHTDHSPRTTGTGTDTGTATATATEKATDAATATATAPKPRPATSTRPANKPVTKSNKRPPRKKKTSRRKPAKQPPVEPVKPDPPSKRHEFEKPVF